MKTFLWWLRPQVVVLELDGCPSWEKASTQLLEASKVSVVGSSATLVAGSLKALRGFHGAVVIATEEARSKPQPC